MHAISVIDAAIEEADRLRHYLGRKKQAQIQTGDEMDMIKATCFAWFNSHRSEVASVAPILDLSEIDSYYNDLLVLTNKRPSRSKCRSVAKSIRTQLIERKPQLVATISNQSGGQTANKIPSFSPLIADPDMRSILERRWDESARCIKAGAPLAATVMMGGLLEGLLLARVNQATDKRAIFRSKSAPKEKGSGKPLLLKEWTLKNYIEVAHELGWISVSAKHVGTVLRDYRNYIHPQKELSHGVNLNIEDAALFWEITKSISRQIIK